MYTLVIKLLQFQVYKIPRFKGTNIIGTGIAGRLQQKEHDFTMCIERS